jgi:hypothetical protein
MASTDTTLMSLDFLPGFHRESTKYAEEGKWFDGNRVRFREGKPENLRGYEKFSTDTIEGFARDILTWTDNTTRKYVAYGTNKQLYVVQNETRYDSTPITTAVSVNNNFTTTSGLMSALRMVLALLIELYFLVWILLQALVLMV